MRDNGCGMNQDELALAWTPFHAGFPGGAGLGLVLCEKIIADHGASGLITSSVGEFSEITVSFPLPVVLEKAKHDAINIPRTRS